jgi:hypothetical protein
MLPDCESTWCWECERANISFPDLETAQMGFEVLDKDGNGDATRDEIEAAILGIHRERLSLEASMRDLDGAVRRLDDIFLGIVFVIALLILAAALGSGLMIDYQNHRTCHLCRDFHPRSRLAHWTYDARDLTRLYLPFRQAPLRCWR